MKKKSEELREQEGQKREAVKAITDMEIVSEGDYTKATTLLSEAEELKTKAEAAEKFEADAEANDLALRSLNEPSTKMVHSTKTTSLVKVEKVWPGGAYLKSFKGEVAGKSAAERAGRFGYFIAAAIGKPWARKFCQDNSIPLFNGDDYDATKAQVETVNTAGGYLVPEEFDTDIIVLREQYGVFRQNVRVSPMARDTKVVPRRSSGLTAYYVGENATITESQKAWNRVQLIAKKLACLAKYSSEIEEDAIVNMGDDLAGEIAYAFANAEDTAGFIGNGTSTYGGIVGLSPAMSNVASNVGINTQASGNTWAALTLADFNSTKALLPQYAIMRNNCKWFISQAFWSSVMERLALAAGGVTSLEILSGANSPRFLGFPVVISQVLPTATAVATLHAFLGDLNLAAVMGDRRQTTIAFSEHLNFAEDEIAIRGTERYDINIHDPGTATVAGPIVALKTGA